MCLGVSLDQEAAKEVEGIENLSHLPLTIADERNCFKMIRKYSWKLDIFYDTTFIEKNFIIVGRFWSTNRDEVVPEADPETDVVDLVVVAVAVADDQDPCHLVNTKSRDILETEKIHHDQNVSGFSILDVEQQRMNFDEFLKDMAR